MLTLSPSPLPFSTPRIVDDDEEGSNYGGSNSGSNNSNSQYIEDDDLVATDGAVSIEGDSNGEWSTDIVKKSKPSSRAGRRSGTSKRVAEDDEAESSGTDGETANPAAFKSPPSPPARRRGRIGGGVGSDNADSRRNINAGGSNRRGGGGGRAFRDAETPTVGSTATTPLVRRRPTGGRSRQPAGDEGRARGPRSVRKSTVSNADGLRGPAFFKARDRCVRLIEGGRDAGRGWGWVHLAQRLQTFRCKLTTDSAEDRFGSPVEIRNVQVQYTYIYMDVCSGRLRCIFTCLHYNSGRAVLCQN